MRKMKFDFLGIGIAVCAICCVLTVPGSALNVLTLGVKNDDGAVASRIGLLSKAVGANHQAYQDELQGIYEEISAMTNVTDRLACFKLLARAVVAFDFGNATLMEREMMSDKFTVPLYGLARSMVRNGATEQEVGDFIINGFVKFHELCFPALDHKYEENDRSYEARRRRMYMRGLKLRWENDASVWECAFIPTVFRGFPRDAENRFLARWHENFGCHDKCHR